MRARTPPNCMGHCHPDDALAANQLVQISEIDREAGVSRRGAETRGQVLDQSTVAGPDARLMFRLSCTGVTADDLPGQLADGLAPAATGTRSPCTSTTFPPGGVDVPRPETRNGRVRPGHFGALAPDVRNRVSYEQPTGSPLSSPT